LAEFLLGTRRFLPCTIWGMAASLSRQLPCPKKGAAVAGHRTGDDNNKRQ